MSDHNYPEKGNMDDPASVTLNDGASLSVNEKEPVGSLETIPTHHDEIRYPGESHANAVADEELAKIGTSDPDHPYPTGAKLSLISLALCLAVFLMALDNTIIATAIPRITDQFKSQDDIGWYGSAYLLTTAAFQLLFGKFYSFFSIKFVFLTAIGIFELGSLVCGAAPNSTALIIGRAIAGIGSAGIFSGALIIVAYSVPLQKRPTYTGLIGAMYGIASVAGPLLGGVFTDKATWRWCFYINLPIGAIAVAVIAFFFTPPERRSVGTLSWKERLGQLDLIGTAFFMPAIICILLALQWGGSTYAWGNARIIALFVLFGVLISAFIAIQFWKKESATVPPRILAKRSIWASSFFAFCLGSGFFIMIYFLPLWFQAVQGVSAVQSGIRNLPMVLALVLLSILSGVGVSVLGYYTPLMIASSVIMAIGFGMITTFTPDTSKGKWIGYQILAGFGVGLGMQQPLIAVQTVLDIKDIPTGTSLLMFLQTLGGALFVSVGQNIFTNKLVSNLAKNVPAIDPMIVVNTGATSIQHTEALKQYLPAITLAYNDALTQAYLVSAAMAAISIIGSSVMEWKSVKGKKIEMTAA
ncbi:MAG: MFS sugar transporter [Claussenomyces sp. TS43310]|nr:MAG: MFS sugar transporter [Claussenomyces sp. TS43310]